MSFILFGRLVFDGAQHVGGTRRKHLWPSGFVCAGRDVDHRIRASQFTGTRQLTRSYFNYRIILGLL